MPFWPSRNSMEHLQNESGLLRALRRDRFFQLLIIVGMALSLFVPLRPAPGLARLTGTPLLPSVG